jgi:hypothetical protein
LVEDVQLQHDLRAVLHRQDALEQMHRHSGNSGCRGSGGASFSKVALIRYATVRWRASGLRRLMSLRHWRIVESSSSKGSRSLAFNMVFIMVSFG